MITKKNLLNRKETRINLETTTLDAFLLYNPATIYPNQSVLFLIATRKKTVYYINSWH